MARRSLRSGIIATVDDDPDIRTLLRAILESAGHRVEEFPTGASILDANPLDLSAVCLDLGLTDMPGLAVMESLRARDPDLPIIIVSVERTVETIVQAMREGAYDFVAKPIDTDRVIHAVFRACERRELLRRVSALEGDAHTVASIVGESAVLREVFRQISQIQSSDVPVCVLGESGTGKELVARAVHDSSRRQKGPFVAINCAAIPESLQESELFGHDKGAFTGALETYRGRFEQASDGTLLLDEIGEMPLSTQAKLLRVLQERTFRRVGGSRDLEMNARIVCATNRDLEAEVRAGRFRADLFFRLVVYPIRLPPLRTRRDDIPHLVGHILRRASEEMSRPQVRISHDALNLLVSYGWPGNVRELENVLQRALLSSRDNEIQVVDLPTELRAPTTFLHSPGVSNLGSSTNVLPAVPMRELERMAIANALERTGGNIEAAARELGVGRATIYRRLAQVPAQDVFAETTSEPRRPRR